MSDFLIVETTAPDRATADALAETLTTRRLAACVHVLGPLRSTYWWEGKREQAEEWLCRIKTRRALYTEVEAAIQTTHPYDTPEIVALPIEAGSAAYLAWIAAETEMSVTNA